MIVTCPRCLTKFNLPEEIVAPGAKFQLHCSRCGWDFLFSLLDEDGDLKGDTEASLPPVVEELEVVPDEASELVELELEGEDPQTVIPPADVEDTVAKVDDSANADAIFELADDFDDDQELSFDAGVDFQEDDLEPEPAGDSQDEVTSQEVEDLALDLDDLSLDDIEFDSFGDDSESVNARPTQLDDEGDFDDLFNQVEERPAEPETSKVTSGQIKEPGKQVEETAIKSPVSSRVAVEPPKATNKRRSFIMVLSCLLVLSLALWVGFGLWQRFSVDMEKHLKLVEIKNQRLRLPSDRIVIVIRGKVLNSSPKLVTDLKIKGVLLDEAGQAVAEVVTAGGVSFSEEELDRLDASKLAMLENNTVTLPPDGGELPFMIAFYDYPEKARECYVELSSFKVKKGRRPK